MAEEVQILSTLDHPHIVHLNAVFKEEVSSVCLVVCPACVWSWSWPREERFLTGWSRRDTNDDMTAALLKQLLCAAYTRMG